MTRIVVSLTLLLALASASLATYPGYAPPAPEKKKKAERIILLANVDVSLFDPNVRDLIYFSGTPTPTPAYPTVEVTGSGTPVMLTPSVPAAKPAPSSALAKLIAQDEAADDGLPLVSEEGTPVPVGGGDLLSRALAGLQGAGCVACHAPSKARGGVALFADDAGSSLKPGIDWRAVLDYTTPKGGNPPACPQQGKGRAFTDTEREPIKALAEGKP